MQGQLDRRQRDLDESEEQIGIRLQQVAGMTADEAKTELLDTLKDEVAHQSAAIIRDSEARTKAEADKKARSILSLAIQRVAADHTAETTVSAIHIPSDDLKGRIIGREGRNIRSFEQLTGTNLIIDDTPECVTISCFDPVRREIGRVTMENLIADGRIHPARIEEMFGKAEKLVNQRVQEAGDQAHSIPESMICIPSSCVRLGVCATEPRMAKTCLTTRWKLRTCPESWRLSLVLTLFRQSVRVCFMTSGRPLTMKSRVAMRSSVPILPVDSAKSRPSFMQSRRITTTSSPIASSTCLCKPADARFRSTSRCS